MDFIFETKKQLKEAMMKNYNIDPKSEIYTQIYNSNILAATVDNLWWMLVNNFRTDKEIMEKYINK